MTIFTLCGTKGPYLAHGLSMTMITISGMGTSVYMRLDVCPRLSDTGDNIQAGH